MPSGRRLTDACARRLSYLAREDPANWYLWIGLLLLAIVFLAPGGLTARVGALAQRVVGKRP